MRTRYGALTGALLALSIPALAGPVSKYDRQTPQADFVSPGSIYDIERCLIDIEQLGGVPFVYSQPDKPDERRLVWLNADHGVSFRIDLQRVANGTRVRAWRAYNENRKGFDACVPAAIEPQQSGAR